MEDQLESNVERVGALAVANHPSVTLSLDDAFITGISRLVEEQIKDSFYRGEDYLATEDVATYLRWPKKRIDNLCGAGAIPFKKIGNRRIFIRREIDEWVRARDGISMSDALTAS